MSVCVQCSNKKRLRQGTDIGEKRGGEKGRRRKERGKGKEKRGRREEKDKGVEKRKKNLLHTTNFSLKKKKGKELEPLASMPAAFNSKVTNPQPLSFK